MALAIVRKLHDIFRFVATVLSRMSLKRIKFNILRPIHLQPCPTSQCRCLRTRPTYHRVLRPRQSGFLPEKVGKTIQEKVKAVKEKVSKVKESNPRIIRMLGGDPDKISLVPREEGKEVEETKLAPKKQKPLEEMTPEEVEEMKRLNEQEKRIAEFERDKREKTKEQLEKEMYERQTGQKIETAGEEGPDNEVYERDIIGRKFKKEKAEYKVDLYKTCLCHESNRRWATRNYVSFTNRPENKIKMSQVAAEIIQDYHRHMNGERLGDMLNGYGSTAPQLPEGLVLQDVDTRHLALPFPPRAFLPTMRLIFTEMKDQVRFALSDKQVNSIKTGASHSQSS